ncbi:hypothetical protein GIB67_038093 [Kingdonia uniflora]|uniref:Uncharacterized protein n=1 Tax=Kingdonia uniflora TaxID=39325 RepID=A0A7J7P7V8_9MAGN|nr:hypothetical protein GIB67_038093 [Kingdonia uniflora]
MRVNLAKCARHFLYSSHAQPLGLEDLAWRMIADRSLTNWGGYGPILRADDGDPLAACIGRVLAQDITIHELQAVVQGPILAVNSGRKKLRIRSDSFHTVNTINAPAMGHFDLDVNFFDTALFKSVMKIKMAKFTLGRQLGGDEMFFLDHLTTFRNQPITAFSVHFLELRKTTVSVRMFEVDVDAPLNMIKKESTVKIISDLMEMEFQIGRSCCSKALLSNFSFFRKQPFVHFLGLVETSVSAELIEYEVATPFNMKMAFDFKHMEMIFQAIRKHFYQSSYIQISESPFCPFSGNMRSNLI